MSGPQWSDSEQGDLLELVARGNLATDTADREWEQFRDVLRTVALSDRGRVDPNRCRAMLAGIVDNPRRVGAFYSRALAQGLIRWTGDWVVSTDSHGKNGGKPCRVYEATEALR